MADISKITPLGSSTTYDIKAISLKNTAVSTEAAAMPDLGDKTQAFRISSDSSGLANDGHIIGMTWSDASKYGAQLFIDTDPTYTMALRQRNSSGTWSTWKKIPMGDGTNASGIWGISITGNAATATTATKTGVASMWTYSENNNELNFGGTNNSSTIYIGYRAKDSKPIPTKFVFGSSTGTADLQAKIVYLGSGTSSYISSTNYTGNAATATALTTNAGSTTQPVYFSDGKPVATSYSLSASIGSGTTNFLTKYTGTNSIGNSTICNIGNISYSTVTPNYTSGGDQYYKAWLTYVCKNYSNADLHIGTANPNSKGPILGNIYDINDRDSTTDLPRYSTFWFNNLNGQLETFGTNNYNYYHHTYLTDKNYTSYTVKKDGTGASGTWGISITGNANTATKATQDASGNVITSTYMKKAGDTMTGELIAPEIRATRNMVLSAGKVYSNISGSNVIQPANTSKLYGNGLAITNPATPNDVGFIRMLGTGETDTILEIATGDDGGSGEKIVVRQYNTSNAIANEAILLNTNGTTSFPVSVTTPKFIGTLQGNADTATSLQDFVVSKYAIPAAKGVRIQYPTYAPVLISCQRANGGGRLILLGGGYGAGGTVRNDFTEIVSSSTSNFTWSLPQSDSISNSIEIMNHQSSGEATVIVWSKAACNFTEITALTTAAINRTLLHSSNYTNYTVTKTGSGASGTWGINITGNAATATKFASSQSITLTGDTTGTASSQAGWSIATTTQLVTGTQEAAEALTTHPGTGKIRYSYNVSKGTTGLFAHTNNANSILTLNKHTGNYDSQLGFSNNGNIYYRNFNATALNNTTAWKQIAYTDSNITGNAATATKLANARTISLTGSVTGSASFDGSGNISIATTTNHTHSDYIPKSIGTTKGDIIYWSAGSTPARLGIGSNGKVLKVVSGVPAWGDVSIPYGETLPSTGTNGDVFLQTSAEYYELPAGGTTGQVLAKSSNADRAVQWVSSINISPSSAKFYPAGSTVATTNSNPQVFNTAIYVENNVLFGAAWNDYAEFRKDNPIEKQEPGRCVRELGDGTLALTTQRLERGCEIISNTFGFAIGQDEKNGYNTPIASSGRVLAYPYESIEEFSKHIGWPVCSGPNGTVSIMTEEEEEKYPSRIIGTISEIPTYKEWGASKVQVNGRIWIRIK